MIIINIKKKETMQHKATKNTPNGAQTNQENNSSYTAGKQLKNNVTPDKLKAEVPSMEELKAITLYLMTKFAATQSKKYALAAYKHLCMISDRHSKNPELQFLNRSLALEWHTIYRNIGYSAQSTQAANREKTVN